MDRVTANGSKIVIGQIVHVHVHKTQRPCRRQEGRHRDQPKRREGRFFSDEPQCIGKGPKCIGKRWVYEKNVHWVRCLSLSIANGNASFMFERIRNCYWHDRILIAIGTNGRCMPALV
jgi:hypothetical protein